MNMVVKYIVRNMMSKKLRTFTIVLSVMIASAVLFASSSFTRTIEGMSEDRLRQYYGKTDIIIQPQPNKEERYFNDYKAKALGSQLDYVLNAIEDQGVFQYQNRERIQLNLLAIDYNDFKKMNNIDYREKLFEDTFSGNSIILSEQTAEKYDIQLGDTLKVFVSEVPHLLKVVGIAQSTSFFREDGSVPRAIVPKGLLEAQYNIPGRGNILFIKAAEGQKIEPLIALMGADYKKQIVKVPISTEEIRQQIGGVVTTFMLMTIAVSMMSIAVIYSSFKVVVMERIKVMGTFRSLGATQKTTTLILLAETFFYGALGGVLGCLFGMVLLYGMSTVMSFGVEDQGVNIQYSYIQVVITLLMAVVLSCISTVLPIMQVSKLSIKEIMFGGNQNKVPVKLKGNKGLYGGVLVSLSLVLPPLLPKTIALISNTLLLIGVVMGMVLIAPYGAQWLVKLKERFMLGLLGSEGQLAMRNVKSDPNMMTNIALLTIAISILVMINNVGDGVVKEMAEFYSKVPKFQIFFTAEDMNRDTLLRVQSVEGVQSAYGIYYAKGVQVKEWGQALGTIEGVDVTKYLDYWDVDMLGSEDEMKSQLDTGRYIMVSSMVRDKFNVRKGDVLTFKMEAGERHYEVLGFINTAREQGNFGIVPSRYLKQDMKIKYFTHILVKTSGNQSKVEEVLKKRFVQMEPQVRTLNEISVKDYENSAQQLMILKGFVTLALAIGVLSVSNNLIISYLQRQRTLAMLRSVGMGKKQILKMLLVESFSCGASGALMGLVGGVLMLRMIPGILSAINQRIVIHYPVGELVLCFFIGIAITMVSSIGPGLRLSKMNIVEQIKMD